MATTQVRRIALEILRQMMPSQQNNYVGYDKNSQKYLDLIDQFVPQSDGTWVEQDLINEINDLMIQIGWSGFAVFN